MSLNHDSLPLIFLLSILFAYEAIAIPIGPPNLSNCNRALDYHGCCHHINSSTTIDFVPPSRSAQLWVRQPAHSLEKEYIEKYENATRLMKSLPKDHPWNFIAQANIHCVYCSDLLSFGIHRSWLFFPWHRCFLYFYERILGKLIGDDTFALPFWNWDSPKGMSIPYAYTNEKSPLYDPLRNPDSLPPAIWISDYDSGNFDPDYMMDSNLRAINSQVKFVGRTRELFLGQPYKKKSKGGGSLEMNAHGRIHSWVGDGGDMNDIAIDARDPSFFAHHANVDRMWEIWRSFPGDGTSRDFYDTDWLNSSFVFWDENMRLVHIKVRDCLDTSHLGYKYEIVAIPWDNTSPMAKEVDTMVLPPKSPKFPVKLDSPINVVVERMPQFSKVGVEAVESSKVAMEGVKSSKLRMEREEVIVVDEIEWDASFSIKIDAYVKAISNTTRDGKTRVMLVGSFIHVPRTRGGNGPATILVTKWMLGISRVLEELRATKDDQIIVELVPRTKGGEVKLGNVWIGFSS